jgi:AcrR family transcriptional regulator
MKAELTRAKIIQAAIRTASTRGLANTHTAEIARAAGVSEGLIFKYFPTKSHLFAVVIDENFSRLRQGVGEIIRGSGGAVAKIEILIAFHFQFFSDPDNILHLIFDHSERQSMIHLESVFEHAFRPYVELISQILRAGIAAGELRPLDDGVVAMAIIGSMQLTLINHFLMRQEFDIAKIKAELTEYILRGIKARRGEE